MLTDAEIDNLWIKRDCIEAIQSGDILAQVRYVVREALAASKPEPEVVAWLYYHSRMEEPLDVDLNKPEMSASLPDDVYWEKPLITLQSHREVMANLYQSNSEYAGLVSEMIEAIAKKDAALKALASALPDDVVKDAARYRWLRGGNDIPPHSVRWPRWEVRNWDGQYWQTLFAEQVDAAIDAAMLKEGK